MSSAVVMIGALSINLHILGHVGEENAPFLLMMYHSFPYIIPYFHILLFVILQYEKSFLLYFVFYLKVQYVDINKFCIRNTEYDYTVI